MTARRVAVVLIACAAAAAGLSLALQQPGLGHVRARGEALSVKGTSVSIGARKTVVVARALRILAETIPAGTQLPKPRDPDEPLPEPPIVLRTALLFKFGKASLSRTGRARMSEIGHILGNAAPVRIRVEGHTDSHGPALFNLGLSRRRACTVTADLRRRLGTDAPQMEIHAFGEARPVAPNIQPDGSDYPAGRRRNRRVVIAIGAPMGVRGIRTRPVPFDPCRVRP